MHIEDLGCDPTWETVDYELCVIRGMRRRLRSAARLMPASTWPDLAGRVRQSVGVVVEITPCVDLPADERRALVGHLRAARRDVLAVGASDPFDLLALEGLIDFLASPEPVNRLGGPSVAILVRDALRNVPRATGVKRLRAHLGL